MNKNKFNIIILLVLLLVVSNFAYATENITFSDVKSTDWFSKNIELLVGLGGISGYPDGTYRPNNQMTKAEFIKILISSLGFDNLAKTSSHWASGYISKAGTLHIVDNSWFKDVDNPISRYEMARIVSNTLTYRSESNTANINEYKNMIKDYNNIPNTLSKCVLESFVKGIVSGYPDGSFSGDRTLTRAEAATIIVKVLDENQRQIPVLTSNNFESEVLRLVNIERKNAGLSPLIASKELDKVAKLKSEDMAIYNYFDHDSPNYGSPFEMMKMFGIKYTAAGENLAKGYKTPESVVSGWMESPGHRKNILNPNFNKLGVGIYYGDTTYWTQLFTN